MNRVLESVSATRTFAASLADRLQPGDVLALSGPLGAGKTTFAQGLVSGLNSSEQVTSPTFVIMQIYDQGRLPVYHFDAYRLESPEELLQIGAEEYFWGDGVALVEWPEKAEGVLPPDRLIVEFSIPGEFVRELSLVGTGPRGRAIVEEMACQL